MFVVAQAEDGGNWRLMHLPMLTLADLPSIWTPSPDCTGFSVVRRLRLGGDQRMPMGWIALSDPLELLLFHWVWFAGQEDKQWFMHPGSRSLWLCERDRRELHHFYGRHRNQPLFQRLDDGTLRLSCDRRDFPVQDASALDRQPLLVAMRPFNEYSVTHFGHFVIELLPLLLLARRLQQKLLLSRPLPVWATELLQLADLRDLESWVLPLPCRQGSSVCLGRGDLSAHVVRGQLLRLQPGFAASLLQEIAHCGPSERPLMSGASAKVAVLSRSHLPKHQRWMNEAELLSMECQHTYQRVVPEQLGVLGLREALRREGIHVVVMAIGSAAYQLFLDQEGRLPVVLLCGNLNPDDPSRWLGTFEPFRQRCWLLFHKRPVNGDWNAPFSHHPNHVDQVVTLASSGMSPRDPLAIGHGVWILPPGVSFGVTPRFGVDFG
ncbi:hypothetical protein SynPROS71_01917 [Synechococcus sp. PROS-7-1]|nr:hypothetical protein SynPROS71_01917 [Synechococcus sp. PROS-7-1]